MINEIDSSASTPLQAVKLLALYLSNPHDKVKFHLDLPLFRCYRKDLLKNKGKDVGLIEGYGWILTELSHLGINYFELEGVVGRSSNWKQCHLKVDCWNRFHA